MTVTLRDLLALQAYYDASLPPEALGGDEPKAPPAPARTRKRSGAPPSDAPPATEDTPSDAGQAGP